MTKPELFENPFKPWAGHMPPYLAGREDEKNVFRKLLMQKTILENLIITWLRWIGKTVLLETLKPIAQSEGRVRIGTDLWESTCVSEENMAIRLLTDISMVTASIRIPVVKEKIIGFNPVEEEESKEYRKVDHAFLFEMFNSQPWLITDKLKYVLEFARSLLTQMEWVKGVVFAYDEAQNLSDHSDKEQFPVSVLLDVFQSIQRKWIPFMLILAWLPTLFWKLVEARTYSERMFKVVELMNLNEQESKDAIEKPINQKSSPMTFDDNSIKMIIQESGWYPYFIQYICRECFDAFLLQIEMWNEPSVPMTEINAKLDSDFFSGRWMRASDRERELLHVIATLEERPKEFSVQEILEKMPSIMDKPLSSSHTNQYLSKLTDKWLIYKTRYGKYSFAVPLIGDFINRWYTS